MVAIKERKGDMHAILGTSMKGIPGPRGNGVASSNDADALSNGSGVRHFQYLAVWASADSDCAGIIQTIICINNKTNLLHRALRQYVAVVS